MDYTWGNVPGSPYYIPTAEELEEIYGVVQPIKPILPREETEDVEW